MAKQQDKSTKTGDLHPIATLGALTIGSQVGSALIQRMGRHPFLLFTMGATAGVYLYKNRKDIIAEVDNLTEQGKALLSKKTDSE